MSDVKEILKKRLLKLEKHHQALEDLKFCIDHFKTLETYVHNVTSFATRYGV